MYIDKGDKIITNTLIRIIFTDLFKENFDFDERRLTNYVLNGTEARAEGRQKRKRFSNLFDSGKVTPMV